MKRFFALFVALLVLVGILTSCSKLSEDPYDLRRALMDKDIRVEIYDADALKGTTIVANLNIRPTGINYITVCRKGYDEPSYENYGKSDIGCFIYCDNSSSAQKIQKDLEAASDSKKLSIYGRTPVSPCIIKNDGTVVYVGTQTVWDLATSKS